MVGGRLRFSERSNGSARRLGGIGAEAKDIVDVQDDGAAFLVGEFAIGIFQGAEGEARAGASFAIFLELHGFAAGPGEGVEDANEGGGIAAEFLVEGTGAEVAEGFEHVEGAELEGSVVDAAGVEILGEVGGGFLSGAGSFEEGLFDEPGLVAALPPAGNVVGGEVLARGTEALGNFGVGDAIEKQLVKLVANGLGETADFATVAAGVVGFRRRIIAEGFFRR